MARSKEFDEERALAAAVGVFWRQGYENTSLEALMREMGIARQSLYDTFGDKWTLYLKAMAFYRESTNSSLRETLASAPTVKEGFTRLLQGLVAESREQHARGCLLLSANMERAVDDEEIARFLEDNQAEVESIFAEALRRGQRGGELGGETDAGALAKFFVATIQGVRAMARLKSDRRALRQVARIALAVFGSLDAITNLPENQRNMKDIELIYGRITQISSYSMRSNTCGSKTRLRISGTKSICLNRSTAKPSSLKKEVAASQSMKASSAMLRPVTSVTRFNVFACFVSG